MQVTLSKLVNNYKEFNINEYVYVKLTDYGKEILRERRERFNEVLISKGIEPFTTDFIKVDEDGFTQFQLWELMNIFGNFMNVSSKLPFETTIRFNKK